MTDLDSTKAKIAVLRFLADQLESGNAQVSVEVTVDTEYVDAPRSMFDTGPPTKILRTHGATYSITARSTTAPKELYDG